MIDWEDIWIRFDRWSDRVEKNRFISWPKQQAKIQSLIEKQLEENYDVE